jgi:hypothetical protein
MYEAYVLVMSIEHLANFSLVCDWDKSHLSDSQCCNEQLLMLTVNMFNLNNESLFRCPYVSGDTDFSSAEARKL